MSYRRTPTGYSCVYGPVFSIGDEESHILHGVMVGTLIALPMWGLLWLGYSIVLGFLRGWL